MDITSNTSFEGLTLAYLHFIVQMVCDSLPEELTGDVDVWKSEGADGTEVEASIKGATAGGGHTKVSLHLSRDWEVGETDVTIHGERFDDGGWQGLLADEIGFNDGIPAGNIVGRICKVIEDGYA